MKKNIIRFLVMSNWIKCSRSQRFELGLSFASLNRIFVFEKTKIFAFHFVFLSVCTNFG